jgi:hypothetical protein
VPNISSQTPGFAVLYRKYPVVADPFGVPDPFRYAEVFVMLDAADVTTEGGEGVVNVKTDPSAVPTAFWAIAQ